MFQRLDRQTQELVEECVQLTYFMRGAVSYEEMMRRTPGERQIIGNFVEKRLEMEAKTPYPVY